MSKALELITLRANAPQFDPAQGEKGLPSKILVLAWGAHATTKGQVICDAATMQQLTAYNAAQNWDRIALDFEHNSVPGSPTYQGEPMKVAGYGTLQLVAGEGIYLLMTSWTPEGREYAAGGHYGDLSPVVKCNERHEVIGLHSVALCRHGATPGLVFLSAAAAPHTGAHDKNRTKRLSTTATMKPEELVLKLAEMLGLAATATPDEVLAALAAKMGETETELSAMKEKQKTLSAAGASNDELKALSAQITTMGEQLKALSTQQLDSQRGEIIAQATREGKQVPSIAKTMGIADLKQLCAELPVTIPLDKRTPDLVALSAGAADSAEQKAVSEMTGVSDDDRKKYANR